MAHPDAQEVLEAARRARLFIIAAAAWMQHLEKAAEGARQGAPAPNVPAAPNQDPAAELWYTWQLCRGDVLGLLRLTRPERG